MRFIAFLILTFGLTTTWAQQSSEKSTSQKDFKIEKGKDVWMMTYIRHRYPTRIEIDAKGNVVEVPLPDSMQEKKLHICHCLSSLQQHPNTGWKQNVNVVGENTNDGTIH